MTPAPDASPSGSDHPGPAPAGGPGSAPGDPGAMTPGRYLRDIVSAPVYRVARHTPLDPMPALSARLGHTVLLKREDLQPVHSFKIRGAFTRMAALSEDERRAGVVTASAGNHAQGVALSGSELGIRSVIVMPVTTPSIKVDAVRAFGGEVVLSGESFDEAKGHAEHLRDTEGLTYVPPFDDAAVIAGQGTAGLEIFQDCAEVDRVFVPVGGGGLAAGVAVLLKQLRPGIVVVGVEPEESACLTAALEAGHPVPLERVSLYAEGVAVKQIGTEPFRLCREYLDEVVTVSSDEISAAVKDIFDDTRAIAEPAGAVATAGLKRYVADHDVEGETLVTVLSGANINFHSLRYISERAELGEGGEAFYAVTIPEVQGSFLRFCDILGGRSVTEFNYRLGDRTPGSPAAATARVFVGVQLKNGREERDAIAASLREAGYDVVDLSDDDLAKEHVRYMVGGRPAETVSERAFSFEFPEHPRALLRFLTVLGTRWNITAFHYRSQGMDYGRVFVTFEGVDGDETFNAHLTELGYHVTDVTDSPAYTLFLQPW